MGWDLRRPDHAAASDLAEGERDDGGDAGWQPAPGKVTRTMRLAHAAGRARLRRKAQDGGTIAMPERAVELPRGGGRKLPAHLESALAAALGRDLSPVRVHDDAAAAGAADRLRARAFAIGPDIYFAGGQYDPDSAQGRHLIAHEVAHTAQDPGRAGELSRPGDADEREADAFADRFAATGAPRLYGPRDLALVSTVAPVAGRVRRAPSSGAGGRVAYPADDIPLFEKVSTGLKTFDVVKPTYVPLVQGMILVDGLPVTYRAGATAEVSAMAQAWAGPARLSTVLVTMTDEQAEDRRTARDLLGPGGEVMFDMQNAPYKSHGNLHFDAGVSGGVVASAGFEAEVAAADMLVVGGIAKLTGGAFGSSTVHLHADTDFDWWVGGKAGLNTSMTATWNTSMTFTLGAEAGIFVELRPPRIPLLSNLYDAVRALPGVSYVLPSPSALSFRREWTRRYPLYNQTKQWKLSRTIRIFGGVDGKEVNGDPEETGLLAMAQSAITDATHQAPIQDIPKEDEDKRPKPDPAAARASAGAQITSTRRTVTREQQWNREMLDAVKARKAAQARQASMAGAPLAVPAVTGDDPEVQLGKRAAALTEAEGAMGDLDATVGKLQPEEKHENHEHRREVMKGYEAVGASADRVGDAIDADQGEFAKPLISDDKAAEKEFNTLLAKIMGDLDPLYDATKGELEWCRTMLEDTSGIAEVSAFREECVERHKHVRLAEFNLERIGPAIDAARKRGMRGDYPGALTDLKGVEQEVASLSGRLEELKKPRPQIPWDVDYVIPDDGQLMLLPAFRKGKTVRERFYGDYYDRDKQEHKGYDDQTKQQMAAALHKIKDVAGNEYWFYPNEASGNGGKKFPPGALRDKETGDMYWLLYDAKQMPTRAHNHPPVAQHWNSCGNATHQSARTEFFNGRGEGTEPLTWEPKSINSRKSSRDKDGRVHNYQFDVRRTFRGT